MTTQVAQRITATVALSVTIAILALDAAPARLHTWARSTHRRGEIVSTTILIAALAVVAVAAGGILTAKVMEHLNRIQ